jgi:hypothetical protein
MKTVKYYFLDVTNSEGDLMMKDEQTRTRGRTVGRFRLIPQTGNFSFCNNFLED